MTSTRLAIALAVFLLGIWCDDPIVSGAGSDPARGKLVYEKHCVACHGPQGKGDGPTGKVLATPAADFTSASSKKKSDADLLKIIENGKPPTAMIAWKGELSGQAIQDVLAYVKSLRK